MSINQNKHTDHSYFMSLALAEAQKNLGNTRSNPSVGCIITKNNTVISAGSTSINGRPHAEQNAINSSLINLRGSNLYVTLEPCSHFGETPPCINLIVRKKIKKVFFSVLDADLRSHNKCTKILRRKKIIVNKGICSKEADFFYRSYTKSKSNLLPFVTCKLAVSQDFFTINKKNKWITNDYSRSRGHLIRSQHDCIITSCRTIINDNPNLNCRISGLENRSPGVIILDKNLNIPIKSNVIKNAKKY